MHSFSSVFELLVFGWACGFTFAVMWHFAVKAVFGMPAIRWWAGPE